MPETAYVFSKFLMPDSSRVMLGWERRNTKKDSYGGDTDFGRKKIKKCGGRSRNSNGRWKGLGLRGSKVGELRKMKIELNAWVTLKN